MGEEAEIRTAKEAADHELILAFGRLQGAASRLEYILGRALEVECGISHLVFEVLLILGRAGEPGLSMRAIAQEQVLTTGGATRLVDRMAAEDFRRAAELGVSGFPTLLAVDGDAVTALARGHATADEVGQRLAALATA